MDSARLVSIVNYLYTGSGRQYGSTASMVEKHRFSGQKAVLFHPQSGAFPKTPSYGNFLEIRIFLTFFRADQTIAMFV
ncbi:MAG: hypothetical protein K6G08_02155 [Prevotella sp.]|nr:hypothetical protein [Prevotella sp.]